MKNIEEPYIKHIYIIQPSINKQESYEVRYFYMKAGKENTLTLKIPFENYNKTIDETDNKKWFEERWKILMNKTYRRTKIFY